MTSCETSTRNMNEWDTCGVECHTIRKPTNQFYLHSVLKYTVQLPSKDLCMKTVDNCFFLAFT